MNERREGWKRDREKKRDEDSGKKEKDRERSRALAVHITLLTIRGQCHRVRPAAPLHFTWLHLAPPLRFSPTLRLLVLPPPPRPAVFSWLYSPYATSSCSSSSSSSQPLHAALLALPRARERLGRDAPSFLFLLSHGRFLSFSIGGSSRARLDLTYPPAVLVLLLLPVPPRPPPPSVLIDRSCTRARRAPLRIVSSRLPRFVSLSSSCANFSFSFPSVCYFLSFCFSPFLSLLLLPLLSFFSTYTLLPPPLPPSSTHPLRLLSLSLSRR